MGSLTRRRLRRGLPGLTQALRQGQHQVAPRLAVCEVAHPHAASVIIEEIVPQHQVEVRALHDQEVRGVDALADVHLHTCETVCGHSAVGTSEHADADRAVQLTQLGSAVRAAELVSMIQEELLRH